MADVAEMGGGAGRPVDLRTERLLKHLGLFLALVASWELAARAELLDPLLFPRPTAILEAFWRLYVEQRTVYWHLWMTLAVVFGGFLAGSILGLGLAIVVGLNRVVRRFLQPYVIVLEATPRIAVAPLIIAALGFGMSSKIAIVMLVCFFAPFVNTLSGMLSVDDAKLELFRSLGASKVQAFRKLMLPDAMPVIMAGLRLAMASALSGALVAEFISAADGMGVLLKRYTTQLNMGSSFACLFTLTAVGFLIYRAMEAIGNRIVFWQHDGMAAAVGRRRAAAWQRKWGL